MIRAIVEQGNAMQSSLSAKLVIENYGGAASRVSKDATKPILIATFLGTCSSSRNGPIQATPPLIAIGREPAKVRMLRVPMGPAPTCFGALDVESG